MLHHYHIPSFWASSSLEPIFYPFAKKCEIAQFRIFCFMFKKIFLRILKFYHFIAYRIPLFHILSYFIIFFTLCLNFYHTCTSYTFIFPNFWLYIFCLLLQTLPELTFAYEHLQSISSTFNKQLFAIILCQQNLKPNCDQRKAAKSTFVQKNCV